MARRARGVVAEDVVDPGPVGEWAEHASCAGMTAIGLIDFFEKRRVVWATSKAVCKGCSVRRDCLSYALDGKLVHGVWGMLDPLELRFALGLDAKGELWTYQRDDVKCVYCRGHTEAVREDETADVVTRACESCGFSWERAERPVRKRRRRATRQSPEANHVAEPDQRQEHVD
jgi:WhiB family redox-sensing transcriptional regulator